MPWYWKSTIYDGLKYAGDEELVLHGFVNLDWTGNDSARKSTSNFCFSLGLGIMSWLGRK